jgi:hypothetical protein
LEKTAQTVAAGCLRLAWKLLSVSAQFGPKFCCS